MRKLLPILMVLSSFTFFSCDDLNKVQVTGIEEVKIVSSNKSEAKLSVFTKIDNPSALPIKVTNVTIDVFYGDIPIGKIMDDSGFELKANAHEAYPIPVTIDVKQLLQDKKKLLSSLFKEGTTLKFVGNVRVSALIFSRDIRVNHSADVNLLESLLD
ncbi:MAG: LEA type 2 family protein [Bacteroidales bacterium]|nr:LEA type 2 family protein [Bacteroidales bacterium]